MFAVQVSRIHEVVPNFVIDTIGLQKAEDGRHFLRSMHQPT
jgi:hypothetical protein